MGSEAMEDRGRLLVACPDRAGIVAAVSRFLFEAGANVVHSDQHTTDPTGGQFFLRVEFDLPELAARRSPPAISAINPLTPLEVAR